MPDLPQELAAALAGRYALERQIGRGGMATVFLATEPRHDRQVAIKVLHPELALSIGTERFLREIRIGGRLLHPHLLPLIDSGEAAGMLYFVMPYIAGGSLRDRLMREGRLEIAEALRITRDIADGLDFAHRQGFIHRDVKPENILFADAHALLADFGLARACDAGGLEGLTTGGLTVGTPAYMSPEQAAGEATLGTASDVYSLACVVYEMLTGRPPFVANGPRETIARHITARPDPVRLHRPDAGVAVEAALNRALAKNPAERFPTVHAFAEALHGRGAPSPGDTSITAQRVIAVLPFVNASPDPDNEYLSDGLTDELIDALVKVDGLAVASRTSVYAFKGKTLDVRAIGAALGAAWVLEGTVRRVGDQLRVSVRLTSAEDGQLLWSERYDRNVADVLAIEEELARTIVETLRVTSFANLAPPVARRYTRNVAAYGWYLRGRFAWNKRSQSSVVEAIGHFERAIAEDPEYAPAYAGLADSYALQLDYRSVPVADGHALAKLNALKAIALDESVAEAHSSLAWSTFIYDWDWATSQREFLRAIELDPSYATAHQWYAFWLASQGRLADGLVEAHTALELDPASLSIRRSVGYAYLYARRYQQVRHHIRRAFAMAGSTDETYRVLGMSLSLEGDHAEAERVLREAATRTEVAVYTTATLGWVLARSGNLAEARSILGEVERRAAAGYVSPVAFAMLFIGLGDLDAALDWCERAVEERRGWPVYFRVNPVVDPLRDLPRFTQLIERVGLVAS